MPKSAFFGGHNLSSLEYGPRYIGPNLRIYGGREQCLLIYFEQMRAVFAQVGDALGEDRASAGDAEGAGAVRVVGGTGHAANVGAMCAERGFLVCNLHHRCTLVPFLLDETDPEFIGNRG